MALTGPNSGSAHHRHRRSRKIFVATFLLVGATLILWAFVFEPASLRTVTYELPVPGWPRQCSGLRVAVLADLHIGSPFNGQGKLDRVVRMINEAQPDLVLLTGDYVIQNVLGGTFVPPEAIAATLRQLSPRLGTWAVLGNHDWWLDGERVRRALESAGIRVLEDASVRVDSGACSFWLTGIGDLWEGRHDVRRALGLVTDQAPVIAVTHNPDLFPDMPARVNLTVAGHTHGGQVRVPFVGRPIVPSRFGERYAVGHIVEDGRHLFVSSGIGTSILPVRFLVPPEVAVLTLRAPTGD